MMSTMVPVLLSLLFFLGPANTQDGPYSLSFNYIGVSKPTEDSPSFQATGYLNDLAFLHYDSESKEAEPLGPWRQIKGMVDWAEETKLQRAREDTFMSTLYEIMDYFMDGGNHTFQGSFGCTLRNNAYCESFWKYTYDGQEYIKFNTEIPAWIPQHPKAVFTKVKWETEGSVQQSKAYLEEECPKMLQRYLHYSKDVLDNQEPPSVSITSQVGPENNSTLKCLAENFYPGSVSMYWTQGDTPLETDEWGPILISENGTYHSWVTVTVPSSDGGPYSCHVQHSSLAQPLTVPLNEGQE